VWVGYWRELPLFYPLVVVVYYLRYCWAFLTRDTGWDVIFDGALTNYGYISLCYTVAVQYLGSVIVETTVCVAHAYVSVITCRRYIAWHIGEETRCKMWLLTVPWSINAIFWCYTVAVQYLGSVRVARMVCDTNAYVSEITCHRYIAWHIGEERRCQMWLLTVPWQTMLI
jgi:hypothetical protein